MDSHELALQSLIGFAVVWLLEKIKASRFKFVTAKSGRLNRVISVTSAVLISGGFTWSLKSMGDHGFDVVIHIPALADLAHWAVAAGWQLLNHEVQYRALFDRPSGTAAAE